MGENDNPLERPGSSFPAAFSGFTPKFSYPKTKGPQFKVQFETTRKLWDWFQAAALAGVRLMGALSINPTGEDGDTFHAIELWNPSPSASKPQGGECYRVTFEVERDTWLWLLDNVRMEDVVGARLYVAEDEAPNARPYAKWSSLLHRSGFLRAPPVASALGTDADYQAWCRDQPCLICSDGDYVNGERRTEYAHVRLGGEGGTGHKPEFSGVPMCGKHHYLQHNSGYTDLMLEYRRHKGETAKGGHLTTVDQAREWLATQATRHLETWAHERLRDALGVTSLAASEPGAVLAWANSAGVQWALPSDFKELSDA